MKKFFLIPLMTLVCSVMAWAGVAKIGNTQYETLNDAFAAANNGDAIYLLEDVAVSSSISINNIKVTLHMQGHTITNNVASNYLFNLQGSAGELIIMGNADGFSANATMEIPAGNTNSFGFVACEDANTAFSAYNVDFEGVAKANYGYFLGGKSTHRNNSILLQDCNVNIPSGTCKGIIFHNDDAYQSTYKIIRGKYIFKTTWVSSSGTTAQAFRSPQYGGIVELQNVELLLKRGHPCQAAALTMATYSDCKFSWEADVAASWRETAITVSGYSYTTDYANYLYDEDFVESVMGDGFYHDYSMPGKGVVNSGEYVGANNAISTMSSGGLIVVNGGKFQGNENVIKVYGGVQHGSKVYLASKSMVIVNGGEFDGNIALENNGSVAASSLNGTSNLEINGGVFTHVNAISLQNSYCHLTIKGGTFSGNAITEGGAWEGYVADGYIVNNNGDNTFTVTKQQSTADTEVSWTEASDWNDNAVPTASSEVSVGADVTVTVGNGTSDTEAEAQSIDLAANSTLIVKDNAILVVGEGGITGSGSVVVEDGGQLLISPHTESVVHPVGTVNYKAQYARTGAGFLGGHVWEHIALPTIGYPVITASPSGYTTYLNLWNINTGWVELDDFPTQFTQNFVGYSLTNSSTTGNVTYTFTGTLVGNADQIMDFSAEGFTYFANSYTGPIDIKALLAQFKTGSDVQRAVYLWDPLNENYNAITTRNAGTGINPAVIKPMQAFFVFSHDAASQEVLYESSVWAPMLANKAAAPARDKKVNNDIVISMLSENGRRDNVALSAKEEAEDNEILKLSNPATSVNIYALSENGNMSYLAENNFNTIYLGITTNGSASYTMQFSGLTDGTYELYDIVANRAIAIVEGATYTFTEAANSTVENRFSVRKISQVVTSMGQVNANNAKVWQAGETLTITDNSAMNDINIYSLNGSLVLSQPATSAAIETISLNGLNNGAYLVKVGNVSAKIVK